MIKRWAEKAVRAVEIRRQRQILHQLPDHMLADIGISRCSIDYVTLAGQGADRPDARPDAAGADSPRRSDHSTRLRPLVAGAR